jgi:hypothetical protein
MKNENHFRPYAFPCFNFTQGYGRERKVTAIVVPVSLERRGSKIMISWNCSMGLRCKCLPCKYSKAGEREEYE